VEKKNHPERNTAPKSSKSSTGDLSERARCCFWGNCSAGLGESHCSQGAQMDPGNHETKGSGASRSQAGCPGRSDTRAEHPFWVACAWQGRCHPHATDWIFQERESTKADGFNSFRALIPAVRALGITEVCPREGIGTRHLATSSIASENTIIPPTSWVCYGHQFISCSHTAIRE